MSSAGSVPNGDRPLLLVESREEGGVLVVALSGEFDLASAQLVDDELGRAEQSYSSVILDLRRLTFMDSTGLHVVLSAESRIRQAGGVLRVVPGGPQVRRLLELTGATDHLQTLDDVDPLGASRRN